MKVIMTQKELDFHTENHDRDAERDDSLVVREPRAPSGWAVYVRMNHWDEVIPIHVETKA